MIRVLILSLIFSGCGGVRHIEGDRPSNASLAAPTPVELYDSSVEIVYTLGHAQHRLLALCEKTEVTAQSFLGRKVLEKATVDRDKYAGFLQKANDFISASHPTNTDQNFCRTPFTVTVRVGEIKKTANGCRSNDEGAIGKLVRDGEFLLYSKK